MAKKLKGYPYAEARFDKSAALVDDTDRAGLEAVLDAGVTDLVVLAHGWNNDMDDARALFASIAASIRAQQDGADDALLGDRKLGVLGVLWPSIRFADRDLIPGGAASFGTEAEDELAHQLEDVRGVFDADDAPQRIDEARALVSRLEDSSSARQEFLALLRGVVPGDAGEEEDATDVFLGIEAEEVFAQLDDPTLDDPTLEVPPAGGHGGAATMDDVGPVGASGAAAGGGFAGKVRAAQRLLNFVTYYQMKARAGTVGEKGLAPLLRSVERPGVRVHLVGHSFGGRLVTAAAASEDGVGRLGTVVLLQAAFSHYGLAQDWEPGKDGAFRRLLTGDRLGGPLVITHTRNDQAVGIAYALASRIANQVAAGVGGPESRWGGIGANGAQRTPGVVTGTLLPRTGAYTFAAGTGYNLQADEFIPDHSTVSGREVAHAILAAVSC